jgi:hypothetical protein
LGELSSSPKTLFLSSPPAKKFLKSHFVFLRGILPCGNRNPARYFPFGPLEKPPVVMARRVVHQFHW